MKSLCKKAVFIISIVITSPLFFLYLITRSRDLFSGQAQLLALVPGKLGSYLRVAYYYMTLEQCSSQWHMGFGSFFAHPEAKIGIKCYIGSYNIIGMVKIGDHATIASHVSILSGKNQHGYGEIGVPIQDQPGEFKIVNIGDNCWIGNNSVVMADLGVHTVVAAGSVVVSPSNGYEVIGGNPANVLRKIF